MIVAKDHMYPHFKNLPEKFQKFSACLKSGRIKRSKEGHHNDCRIILIGYFKDVKYRYAVVSWIVRYTCMRVLEEYRDFELVLRNLPQHNSLSVDDACRIH